MPAALVKSDVVDRMNHDYTDLCAVKYKVIFAKKRQNNRLSNMSQHISKQLPAFLNDPDIEISVVMKNKPSKSLIPMCVLPLMK